MAAVTAGIISAAGGLIGDMFSSSGQSQTNQTNMQIAQMNNDFNAQQAALNRQWQQQSQMQAEQFDAGMANTAVQRRMQDLQQAGLNPQLAIGNPASSPMVGGQSGSTASSAGLPQIGNPLASFSNLGNQTAQALQTSSQVQLQSAQADAAKAQAKLTESQTPTEPPAKDPFGEGVDVHAENHVLGNANVANINADTELKAAEKQRVINLANYIIDQDKYLNGPQTTQTEKEIAGQNIQNAIAGQDYKILIKTKDALIAQALQAGTRATNEMGVDTTAYGRGMAYITRALPAVNTAISALGAARGGLGGAATSRVTQNPNWTGDTSDDWKNFHLPLQQ